VWIVTAMAGVVLVLGFVLHAVLTGPESVEKQIGDQVYEGCVTTVSSIDPVARRWPQASKSEVIVCQASENDQTANDVMQYAQFESATALSAALTAAPPDGRYCTISRAVVTEDIFLDDFRDAFAAMCANRGGTLHEGAGASPHLGGGP
jgi:hypothetical protein